MQSFADVLQNRCSLLKFGTFHRKTPVLEFLFDKVAAVTVCNFIKKRQQYRCFPVKFATFLRTSFFTEHLRWLAASKVFCKDLGNISYEKKTALGTSLRHKCKCLQFITLTKSDCMLLSSHVRVSE